MGRLIPILHMSNPATGRFPYEHFTSNLVDALNDARAVRRAAMINADIALKEAFGTQPSTRVKCVYCGSKYYNLRDNCKNCGAPLP
jgi:hypothetical protein